MTKRARGEGTIFPYRGGYRAQVDLGRVDGKRLRRTVEGKTRREAGAKLGELLEQHRRGMLPATEQTLGAYLADWLEGLRTDPDCPDSTFDAYARQVRLYINPILGGVKLAELTAPQVNEMLRRARARLGGTSRHHLRATLKTALARGVRLRAVAQNVASLSDVQVKDDFEPMFLDEDQARAFLAAIVGDPLEALYRLALTCGPRAGEALGLTWDRVDLERGVIHITRQLVRIHGAARGEGLVLTDVKTKHSRRTIDLPPQTAAGLRAHRTRQKEQRLLAGLAWQDTGLVFTSSIGTALGSKQLAASMRPILVKVGLPIGTTKTQGFRFHDLRHTCATLHLMNGTEPEVVRALLGHRDIATTLRLYGHAYAKRHVAAAARMDAILSG